MKSSYYQVKFTDEWYEPILEGRKTQTMRIPSSRWEVQEEDIVLANFKNIDKKILLEIKKVGYKNFGSINDEDAKREGVSNAAELKHILQEIYEGYLLESYNRVYYYRFEVIGVIEEVRDTQ